MIFIFFIPLLHAAQLQGHQDFKDFQDPKDQCPSSSCNPQLGDLMVGRAAQLSASSTCGLQGPQNYCTGYLEEEQKCFTCSSQMPFNRHKNLNSHRIENVITTFDPDRQLQWWQSENGIDQVSIQLDLEAVFQFSHLVLTFKSFRPAAMLVERSKDFGRTWKVFRYFSDECSLHFPWVSDKPASSINDVVCDRRYSGPEPSTNGQVVLKALDPVFDIQNPYTPNIQDLITLTNLRVNFTHLFTLGDTLLSWRRRNPQGKYYYALYNMMVQGSCFCNGHAMRCLPVSRGQSEASNQTGMVHGRCVCQHNTAGDNCEVCQRFYHDSPWRPGGQDAANSCRKCNCHGHSDSCHFDAAQFEATGGVSGGVCDNCQHNRTGPQCDQCGALLYQDPERELDDPHACIPCDCDPAGSKGWGHCDVLTGQCVCKQNAAGRRCDHCKQGFFRLSQDNPAGCQACQCHVLGSIGSCDELTGSCECDRFTTGLLCDQCQASFWGLGNSVYRCSPCGCDMGGAYSSTCSQEDGQCHCLPNMVGPHCAEPAPGYFLPLLDYFLYEAELAATLTQQSGSTLSPLVNTVVLPQCEQYFRDQGFDFKFRNGQVILVRRIQSLRRLRRQRLKTSISLGSGHAVQFVPRQRTSSHLIMWTGLGLVRVLEGAGLRFTVDNLPLSLEFQLVIHYETEHSSDWSASVSIIMLSPGDGRCSTDPMGIKNVTLPKDSRVTILDSAVCLNAGGRYFVDVIFTKESGAGGLHILIDSMGLIPSTGSVQDFCSQRDVDSFHHFHCVGLAMEQNPQHSPVDICEGLIKMLSARIHNGALSCRCNLVGSLSQSCSKLGGFCECKLNVIGRCCDTCAPLTFGFGPDGCKSCECDPRGSLSELCDQVGGQCVCHPNAAGRQCDHCQNGFWGFPICQPCECNGLSEMCDEDTGKCVNCRNHTRGPHCDRCVDGYYNDPVSGIPCQPCLCPDVKNTGRFFATSCHHDPQSLSLTCICREGHTGPHCDRCRPGFYGSLMSPDAFCKPCPCNNNIDTDAHDACDSLTGQCLHCLYNTMGRHCQHCKPGYYGNALEQDCRECLCDRRGTEVSQCPLRSPCFCDPTSGACPCRSAVVGFLCDQCEDGYWNLNGALGCQSCSCHPVNSLSNICNKVTGQCPCRAEFRGVRCDECGENYFGNSDLQCVSCDCNREGSEHPSCDPETGECICRMGVTGIFCDECAPGHMPLFPGCEQCHMCTTLWSQHVTDVQQAAQKMKSFISYQSMDLPLGDFHQQILTMYSKLEGLSNLTELSLPKVEKVEKVCLRVRRLKDTIDTNIMLMDLSPLLTTEINNIHLGFRKLFNNLKEKLTMDQVNDKRKEELLIHIQNLHASFLTDDGRLRNATTVMEHSIDTRQEVKSKLSMCSRGTLTSLMKNTNELTVVNLSKQICGGPVLEHCSGFGGALCKLKLEKRQGGLNCNGVLHVSQKASETADKAKNHLTLLPYRLEESRNQISKTRHLAQNSKDQAKELQDRINNNTDLFKREKNRTWKLTQQAKAYLMDEMVPAEDIQNMIQAVLTIQLPQSPDHIQTVFGNIYNVPSNTTNFQDDLTNLEAHSENALDLLQKAHELKKWTINAEMTKVGRDIKESKEELAKALIDLKPVSRDRETNRNQVHKIKDMLDKMDTKLMMNQPEDLQKHTEVLMKKTEQNRETARYAKKNSESALATATDTDALLEDVMKQFQVLKQKSWNQTFQTDTVERLKNIVNEVENMTKQVDDNLRQILGLEQRILQLIMIKQHKSAEVFSLLGIADSLHQEISRRAKVYANCAS
ncbi:laminin subunit beta-4 isoform X2 [Betta splendens]|uniref:Laminin subunit beta-4 isoform X2 n=1 Tax=Betta splendens TaxID=158456 RepID=A0A9W2XUY1_BETSP|nr:laminin subunit beta-4 isoform X2 [Betta splendens]